MIKRHPFISVFALVAVLVGLFLILRPAQVSNAASKSETAAKNDAKDAKKDQERKLPVEVAVAKNGTISSSLITTASLEPDRQVTLIAETNGTVDRLLVEEGNGVREGQLLAVLSEREKAVKLEQAKIRVENAKQELERKDASFKARIISESEYDKAKYEMEVAIAEQNAAQVELDRTTIRAPFSGIITERFIEKGQNINPEDKLFTLADVNPLEAKVYLPEKEIFGVKTGQSVQMALNSQKNVKFEGTVRQINPAVDPKTGTVKVTVEINKVPQEVRPGSFVDVKMVTRKHDNALLIPKKALLEEAGERFVYVIENNKATRRVVTIGFTDDVNAEILSGVSEAENVVIAGQGSLRDGSKTEIVSGK